MPRPLATPALLGLLATLGTGCSGADASESMVTVDTLPGGILNVTTAEPIERGRWAIVHERDVQPAEGEPGELLSPKDIALADDGTLYVVETGPSIINVYAPDGAYLRSLGGNGAGPGEFSTGFIALRGDTLVLQDPQQSRATVYEASTGRVLSIRPTACCYWHPIRVDGNGRALAKMMSPPDSTKSPSQWFIRFPIGREGTDTVRVMQAPAVADEARWTVGRPGGGGMMMSTPVPMWPRPHEEVDPLGGMVTGYGGEYRLRRTRGGVDTIMLFGRPPTNRPVTAEQKQAITEKQVQNQLQFQRGSIDETALRKAFDAARIPDSRPAFERVHVDGAGRVWVRQSVDDSMAVHFDLFDRSGRWLDEVQVANTAWARSLWASVSFSADRVAVIDEDDAGLPVIRIYRIARSDK